MYLQFVGTGYPEGVTYIQPFKQSESSQLGGYSVITELGNNWKAETFGFFRSPSQSLQGSTTTFSMMSFGIKKTLKNKTLKKKIQTDHFST